MFKGKLKEKEEGISRGKRNSAGIPFQGNLNLCYINTYRKKTQEKGGRY